MTRGPAVLMIAGLIAVAGALSACSSTARNAETLTATPDRPDTLAETNVKLGIAYLQQGKADLALGKLQRALELEPNLAIGHNAIAILYEQLGKLDLAGEHYQRAVEINPQDSAAHNNYGTFLCGKRNQLDKAEQQFLEALKNPLYDTPDLAYENAGLCAKRVPDAAKAEQYFRKALEINPRLPNSLYQMALISLEAQRYLPARAYLQRYSEVAKHTSQSLWLGIRIERELGDKNAVSSYSLYLKSNFPDSDEAKLLRESENSPETRPRRHGIEG